MCTFKLVFLGASNSVFFGKFCIRTKWMISNPQNHLYTSAISKEADTDRTDGPTTSVASSASQWETNIVVAFNVSSVDVNSNMGNVMGQAT